MESFDVDGKEILVIHADGGKLFAVQGICPHQEIPLEEGTLKGKTLTCRAHLWQFDVMSGAGVNPEDCRLAVFPVELRDEDVYVDADAAEPFFATA